MNVLHLIRLKTWRVGGVDRECVRNLDLRVQTVSMIGSPWGISEKEEGIHPIW